MMPMNGTAVTRLEQGYRASISFTGKVLQGKSEVAWNYNMGWGLTKHMGRIHER